MRNIKFRGYNEINKKMLNWNELLDTNLKNIFTMQKKDTGIILMQYPEHNDRYLIQCYYNLQEKADRRIISEEEWLKIEKYVKELI